jgi:succinyl-CoA synthetase beta subunit
MDFDSNALYRHPDIQEYRDMDEEDPTEVEASQFGLNYIHLGGAATSATWSTAPDWPWPPWTSSSCRRKPANFLDVGGGANAQMVENGFRILLGDENVKGILINIFGGILRCDRLANGVVQAAKRWACACRWSFAWRAPTWKRAAKSWPNRAST